MPSNKKTSKQQLNLLRNAATPYTLHLGDEPYILTEDDLNNQVDDRLQRKRSWSFPGIKFISIKDQLLKLRISNREESYEMAVNIEPDKLSVTCSCGSQVQTMCNHAYQALAKIIAFAHSEYFKRCIPNGLIEIAFSNRKHFKIKPNWIGLSIEPDATLGSIYKIADKMDGLHFQDVLNLPQEAVDQETVRVTDLTYIILYSSKDKYFPFLQPCLGILNKAGTDIKGFYNFLIDTPTEYDAELTDEQKKLNVICQEMYGELKAENGSLLAPDLAQTSCAVNLFNLWNQAFSILRHQPHIYRYNFYYKYQLKDRPRKCNLQRVILSKQNPLLFFQLIDKGAFYQLKMNVTVKGVIFKDFEMASSFFICNDKSLYMLSSLRDVGIAEWMRKCNNCITVFKEHFSEFEKQYLEPLSNNYRLEIIPSKK